MGIDKSISKVLDLLKEVLPVFIRLVDPSRSTRNSLAGKDADKPPDAKLRSDDLDAIYDDRYRPLWSKLRRLNFTIEEYDAKTAVSDDAYDAASDVASTLDKLILPNVIKKALKNAHLLVPKDDNDSDSTAESSEDDHPNLTMLQIYKVGVSEKDQEIINTLSVLKRSRLERKIITLSTEIDSCELLLRRQGQQSTSNLHNLGRKRYSQKDFQQPISARQRSDELYKLLCHNWPCKCNEDHKEKLGSCAYVKLRLRPDWMLGGTPPSNFDLILHGEDIIPRDCNVEIKTGCSTCCETGQPCRQPCQILLTSTERIQLKIVATQQGEEFSLCHQSSLESSLVSWSSENFTTLQDLVREDIILKPKERRILAIVLAHSLLQLLGGQWIHHSWNGMDVSFYNFSGGNMEFPNFRRPYLLKDKDKRSGGANAHPMPGMVTLGRILLELERKYTSVSSNSSQDSTSEFVQARLLLDSLKDWDQDFQAIGLFIESISKCLDMATYPSGLKQADLMWEIYSKVIYPLEQELLRMCGASATLEDMEALLLGSSVEAPTRLNVQSVLSQPLRASLESGALAGSKPVLSNYWSDEWFHLLKSDTEVFMEEGRKKTYPTKNVVDIAILDTGVDLSHPHLTGKIAPMDCMDFVNDTPEICDDVGHGTHTASLLIKTATTARVCCGRVFSERKADDETIDIIAKAIRHAVDKWNVQIITMSFALYDTESNHKIKEALRYAASKRVLLFAAASNDRLLESNPIAFPASDPHVFCIFSEETPSFRSKFSPLGRKLAKNFSILGEDVDGAWPLKHNDKKETRRETGTSCATPIAAGVAALVLEYSKQKGNRKVNEPDSLRDRDVMERVLFECMTDKNEDSEYNLLKPWMLFKPGGDRTAISVTLSNLVEGG